MPSTLLPTLRQLDCQAPGLSKSMARCMPMPTTPHEGPIFATVMKLSNSRRGL